MPYPSSVLMMAALPSVHDTPPNAAQPPLVDGIHLRWALKTHQDQIGYTANFPNYGHHVYRRIRRGFDLNGDLLATRLYDVVLEGDGTTYTTPSGWIISSDKPLALRDDFAPSNQFEFDLSNRGYLSATFPQNAVVCEVMLQLGFITGSNVRITGFYNDTPVAELIIQGTPNSTTTATLKADLISRIEISEADARLIDGAFLSVTHNATWGWQPLAWLPLPLTHPNYGATTGQPFQISADRTLANMRVHYGAGFGPAIPVYGVGSIMTVHGSPLITGQGTNWDDSLCGNVLQVAGAETVYTIHTVLSPTRLILGRPYDESTVAGAPYSINRDPFGTLHDQLVAHIHGQRTQPAVVESLGTVSLIKDSAEVAGLGTQWTKAYEGLTFQAAIPTVGNVMLMHGSKTVKGNNTQWGSQLEGGTIYLDGEAYGIAAVDWLLQRLTLDRFYAGPTQQGVVATILEPALYTIDSVLASNKLILDRPFTGASRADVAFELTARLVGAGTSDPSAQALTPPDIVGLLQIVALHPGMAQALGLYYIDREAQEGITYDYMVVANNTIPTLDPLVVLANIQSNGFAQVEAAIAFNLTLEPSAPLPDITGVTAYALPDYRPSADGTTQPAGSVGLRWDLGVYQKNIFEYDLLPGKPVAYHIWHADLGDKEPEALPEDAELLTAKMTEQGYDFSPVLVPAQFYDDQYNEAQRPPHWPPFPLYYIHADVPDSWHCYGLMGQDIFGRFTNPTPARWMQWAPMPQPRPWYYIDPEGATEVFPFAVCIRDETAPPPPQGLEAFILQPGDPFRVGGDRYDPWYASLSHAAQQQTWLRVRWFWMHGQHVQAPDTHEFRIYFKAGKTLTPPWGDPTGWDERIAVVDYDAFVAEYPDPHEVALDPTSTARMRMYEVFLPAPAGMTPSLASPKVFGHIGVTAADDKQYISDATTWDGTQWGQRYGNEGDIHAPSKIFCVNLMPPPHPITPPYPSNKEYATPADYQHRSYYTYRWARAEHLKTHVMRALDETIFQTDWAQRPNTTNLMANPSAYFPADIPTNMWQGIAGELAVLNGFSHDVAGEAQAFEHYRRGLSPEALRVLAGLPWVDSAYVQLTVDALETSEDVGLYVDTLDGRAVNAYFYRAAYVDGANNYSAMSLASVPIYLPDVVAPKRPTPTSILSGDRQILLNWTSNQEADLKEYRVYRTFEADHARDIRLMTQVATVAAEPDPMNRPVEVAWSDTDVPALTNAIYRIVAVDLNDNQSEPSVEVMSRAYDLSVPNPPTITTLEWVRMSNDGTIYPYNDPIPPGTDRSPAVHITWTAQDSNLTCLVQGRLLPNGEWRNISDWLPVGTNNLVVFNSLPYRNQEYRIKVRNQSGTLNTTFSPGSLAKV